MVDDMRQNWFQKLFRKEHPEHDAIIEEVKKQDSQVTRRAVKAVNQMKENYTNGVTLKIYRATRHGD